MACYHPKIRYVTGVNSVTGKSRGFIYPRFVRRDGRLQEVYFMYRPDKLSEWKPWFDPEPPRAFEYLTGPQIKCGVCEGCRMDVAREWANRLLLERESYDDNSVYFVTLTYDDAHVPKSYYADPDTGEAQPANTLSPRDVQLFMKRLRKRHVAPLRFFLCGEYGPQTFRPHYHAIIFGLQLNDLVPYGMNDLGQMTYQSNFLTSCWSIRKAPPRHGSVTLLSSDPDYFCEPLGRVVVAPATWNTFAYVARYATKKLYGPAAKFYQDFNLTPPFLRMSNKPGIGRRFFDEHPDLYDFEWISVSTPTGGKKFRPPHYFDRLYDAEDPEAMDDIKRTRQLMAQEAEKAKLFNTSLTAGELLEISESEFRERCKKFVRKDV